MIEYYAGRYFTHDGVAYTPGQKVPREQVNKWPSIEAGVRGRYLIPIAQDYHEIPRHLWPEAQSYEYVLRKHREKANRLNLPAFEEDSSGEVVEDPQEVDQPEGYDPAKHTVDEVVVYVDENPDQLETVYEAEQEGKGRRTLLRELEERREQQ
jgi:hypothetical protein